jgi:peptidoglycan/xylan/chitin deacetylase (PgdA/CDA1 family)
MSCDRLYVEHRHGIREPLIALTFDDGPSDWTDAILDHLAAHGARATFFVVGEAIQGPERERTLRRTVECASEVANHTYTHRQLPTLDDGEIRDEIGRTNELIEQVTSAAPRYWRAPHFRSDDRVRKVISELGLLEVRSSVFTGDYKWPTALTAAWVVKHLQPGAIVDLHDGRAPTDSPEDGARTREATVDAVGLILAELEPRGYRCVTVSELLAAE